MGNKLMGRCSPPSVSGEMRIRNRAETPLQTHQKGQTSAVVHMLRTPRSVPEEGGGPRELALPAPRALSGIFTKAKHSPHHPAVLLLLFTHRV